jgi:hypothetical protein
MTNIRRKVDLCLEKLRKIETIHDPEGAEKSIKSELNYVKSFFGLAKGSTPMCCSFPQHISEREIVGCDYYQGTPESFRNFCLACQSYIEEKIRVIEKKLSEFEQNLS